jgi:L-alanine-DL-glutamate epimerase-like enolase superfamily enzyme
MPDTRRSFLRRTGLLGGGVFVGAWAKPCRGGEPVGRLDRIERIAYRYKKNDQNRDAEVLRAVTADGVVGGGRVGGKGDLARLQAVLKDRDLFDHEAVWKAMAEGEVGDIWFRAAVDMVCWDLHARTRRLPLHALLGTRRRRYRPYGDERWRDTLTPESYARGIATGFRRTGKLCTKLHIPGTYKLDRSYARNIGENGWTLDKLLRTLRLVREAVGDEAALAYDPHPQKAASLDLAEARQVAGVLDELRYEWVECLLPPEHDRMADWLALRKTAKLRFQREESPSQTAEEEIRWLAAGAANQVTWDCRFGGITALLRIVRWARAHPEQGVTFNLHYKHASHEHVAASMTDTEFPWVEACFDEARYRDGYTSIPDWIGVENPDWDFIEKHRI